MSISEIVGIFLVVWALLALMSRGAAQRDHLTRLEQKLDVLLRQQGLEDSWRPTASERVRQNIVSGGKDRGHQGIP